MMLVGHVLDHVLDHMIIGIVTMALYFFLSYAIKLEDFIAIAYIYPYFQFFTAFFYS